MHEILGIVSVVLFAGSAVGGVLAWQTRPRGDRCRCPGPRNHPWFIRWIHPGNWLWRGRCWYQLGGHVDCSRQLARSSDLAVICPECGATYALGRLKRDGRRLRLGVISAGLLLVAVTLWLWPAIAAGGLIRPVPTLALIALDRLELPDRAGGDLISDEVARRLWADQVDGWSATILSRRLAVDLLDDEVKWNASSAAGRLRQLWPHSQQVLEQMLTAGDAQARVVAARILREKTSEPTTALLEATIEDLRDDSREVDYHIGGGWNAQAACTYLVAWAYEAKPQLQRGMRSADRQQRLLSAAIVAYANMTSLTHEAAPILIEHLRDNDIRGDAKVAAPALFRLGPAVIPYLREHINSDDQQLRLSALAIIERLERPDVPYWKMTNQLPRITETTTDPLIRLGLYPDDLRWPAPKTER